MDRSRKRSMAGTALAFLLAAVLFACTREYDSPYVPGSNSYAGDEWTRDGDGNGVADSVEKYAPECPRGPKECIENAKVLSRIGLGYSLYAVDMILWLGTTGNAPRITWDPAEASVRGFTLSSSDTTKVRVRNGKLEAVGVGNAQVSIAVTGEYRVASFIAKVVPKEGKKVLSISAKDMTLEAGKEAMPDISWTPPDAEHKEYILSVDDPSVGWPVGGNIKAIFAGKARVTVEALDGGHKSAFTLTVTETPQKVEAVSVGAEDMYMLVGEEAEAPIVLWNPSSVTDKRILLAPVDTLVAGVNGNRDRIVPKAKGKTQVNLYTLESSPKSAFFTVYVNDSAVEVQSLSAADMKLTLGSAPATARLDWLPADATNRKYSLKADSSEVVVVEGLLIVPFSLGRAQMIATSEDGGFEARFLVDVVPQDTAIHVDSIRAMDMSLSVGFERQPLLTWYPEDAGNQEFTLLSSDASVATVNGTMVRAVRAGAATITVRTVDGDRTATFEINVVSPIIPVQTLQGEPMSMVVGAIESPSLSWYPGTATNLSYTLVSDNTGVARILDSTSVEALAVGTANVIVRSKDGPADTIKVTVNAKPIPVTGISMTGLSIAVGDPLKDVASLIQWTPFNATDKTFKLLSSSNPGAAAIVENRLQAVASGTSNVIIESQDVARARDTFTVTVRIPVKALVVQDVSVWPGTADIDPSSLIAWTPTNADNKTFVLTSLDTVVAGVVNGNRIRPKASGIANVILRSLENSTKFDTFKVTVKVPVKSLTIRDTTLPVGVRGFLPNALVTWNPWNASDKNWFLTWVGTPYNTVVDSVTWKFNTVGPGKVYLVFNSNQNNSAKDTFAVTVVQPVTGVSAAGVSLRVGEADVTPMLIWSPGNASDKGYTLSGGTAGIATAVSGKVHAEGPGTATFTVRSNDGGKLATFTATITQPVSSVAAANLSMKVGDADASPNIAWTPSNASDKGYTLSGGTAAVATVVSNRVHAVGPGTATFTVTTSDGAKTAIFTATITQPVLGITAANLTMNRGDSDRDPVLTWSPSNASNKGYTLSGGTSGVATVALNKVHPVGAGTTTFTVTTSDGAKTATFTVTVVVPVTGISAGDMVMRTTDADELPVLTWSPSDATNKGYTLTSLDIGTVTIVAGKIHPVSRGQCSVRVTTADGAHTNTFVVEVRNAFGF